MINVIPIPKTKFLIRVVPYIGMFLLALLLWLPFGFKTTGLIEELGINLKLDRGAQLFFVTPQSVMQDVRMRPFQIFIFAAAYALDHDSYLFYNIFMMLFFFGQMVVVYWLVLQFLPGKKALAFVTGVLFTIYPADTGLFSLRTIHIHCALLAYLMAVYLLIQFWKQQGRMSWLALLGAMALLIFSLGQYQIALVAAAVTPFMLVYFKRPDRRFFIGSGVWYAGIVVVLLYAFWANQQSTVKSYESGLLLENPFSIQAISAMIQALLVGYQRQFSSWATAISHLNDLPLFWPFIAAGLIISLGVIGWLLHEQRAQPSPVPVTGRQYGIVLLGSVLLFAMCLATYLPFPSLRLQDFRIYFLAMLGSATVLTLGLYLLSLALRRFSGILFAAFTLPFIGLALLNAFQQQQYFVNFSLQQQSILQQTVAQAPQIKPNTVILMLDRTDVLNQEYVFYYGYYLSAAMQYLYADPTIQSNYCLSDNRISTINVRCHFDQNGLVMSYTTSSKSNAIFGPLLTVSSDRLLIFSTELGGRLRLLSAEEAANELKISGYDPQARIIGQVLPHRAATLFSCEPALSCYKLPPPTTPTTPSTSFDLPTTGDIGIGWRTPEDDGAGGTFRWSIRSITSVDLNLSDSNDLALDFKVLHWVEDSVIDSLKLTLHDQDIPLTFSPTDDGGRLYHAIIPRSLLTGQSSQTYLVFATDRLSANLKDVPLGFALNWLHIHPS